jgi:hypothetical protein
MDLWKGVFNLLHVKSPQQRTTCGMMRSPGR